MVVVQGGGVLWRVERSVEEFFESSAFALGSGVAVPTLRLASNALRPRDPFDEAQGMPVAVRGGPRYELRKRPDGGL